MEKGLVLWGVRSIFYVEGSDGKESPEMLEIIGTYRK